MLQMDEIWCYGFMGAVYKHGVSEAIFIPNEHRYFSLLVHYVQRSCFK